MKPQRPDKSFRARALARPLIAATLLFGSPRTAVAQTGAPHELLSYTIQPHFGQAVTHVELTWETHGRRRSVLGVSSHWGQVDNVPALLKNINFKGVSEVRVDGPNWIVSHADGALLSVSYDVDAGRSEIDWDHTHAPITTAKFFHGMGNAFLMAPQALEDQPATYQVVLHWNLAGPSQNAVCSWGAGLNVTANLAATDLRHSVYLAGDIQVTEDRKNNLVVGMVAAFDFPQSKLADLAARIINAQKEFMQEKNFPRFVVTAIPVGAKLKNGEARLSGAGLYDSFALFAAPGSKLNDAAEHLFAHELFHYWNGRTLQAEDPERLVFWFTEGFTDYYSLRILHESGIWGPATYIAWINKHVREYFANSARNASNEDIQRDYWTQRDTVGEVAYQRGLLLGLRWNALAKAHGAKDGIDALFKPLVKRGKENGLKLSNPLIRQAGISTLGEWFGPEFDKYVQAAATIDLPADALAPDFTGRVETIYDFQLGFEREPSLKAQKVLGLVHGSKADAAGLKNGDELLAWNIPGDASQPVDLTIKRGREARKVTYYPQGKPHEVLQFHRSATSRPTTQASIHR